MSILYGPHNATFWCRKAQNQHWIPAPRLLCLIWLEKIINSWNQIGNHQLENMSHESINIIKSSIRNWQKISRNQNPIKVQKLTFGTPIAGWFKVENRIYKWLIWGYAHGLETSIFLIICFHLWTRIKSTRSQVTLAASIPLLLPLCCCRTWRCPSLGLECGPWQWNYFCSCVGSFFSTVLLGAFCTWFTAIFMLGGASISHHKVGCYKVMDDRNAATAMVTNDKFWEYFLARRVKLEPQGFDHHKHLWFVATLSLLQKIS